MSTRSTSTCKPGDMAKFIDAVKENGAAAVKEPGCREFNITVLAKDPNHVFLYVSTTTRPR